MSEKLLDARGLKCPMPIVKAKKELQTLQGSEMLRVVSTDPGSVLDFQGWLKLNPSFSLVSQSKETDETGRDIYLTLISRSAGA